METLIADFVAGAILCNGIPHLVTGLRGEPFPSPFARPPGRGDSHPVVNVIWGLVNIVGGIVLLDIAPVTVGINAAFIATVLGAAIGGSMVAAYFYKVRGRS